MTLLVFIFGLAIGSFLNAYIWRLKTGGSIWRGRSMCPKCKRTLQWFELVPLVSFVIQGGRCRGCKQKIDWQYPLVELATAVLFILAFWKLGIGNLKFVWILDFGFWILLKYWYFFAVLIILFVYDLRYGLIPDRVVLPAIAVALLFNLIVLESQRKLGNALLSQGLQSNSTFYILYSIFAIVIGAAFFAIQHYASRGRWVGAGDIRFGALMGAMLGWPQILIGLLVSYIIGGVVAAGLLLMGQKKFGQTVPMGTFLAIGTIMTILWGKELLKTYFPL